MVATTLAVSRHAWAPGWEEWRRNPVRVAGPAALVLAAIAFQVPAVAAQGYRGCLQLVQRIRAAARDPSPLLAADPRYHALQASIPAGAPLLVMLDRPFWLDFRRNPIEVIDMPGQVSPPPGIPFDDDEALVAYLAMHGFRYLAFVRSTASENQYSRKGWQRLLGPPPSPLWGRAAPFVLRLFDRFESLSRSRVRLYDDGALVALDLATRTDARAP
jgi:hypothetical protein